MRKTGAVPCLFTYLADACGIDPYSYEYDVMVMGALEFEESAGFATDFIRDGQFDSEGFECEWRQRMLEEDLHEIASRCLGKAPEDIPGLKDALMGAYLLGRRAPKDPF